MSPAQLSEDEPKAQLPAPEPRMALPEPEKPAGSRVRKWIIVLLVLLAIGAVVWKIRSNQAAQTAQASKQAATVDRAVPVQVVAAARRTVPIYLSALGTVSAYNTVTIKSRVDGQLMRVNVREGQAVRKGDLLMEIDPKPYLALVAQAEGQLAKDQAAQVNATAQANRYTALLAAGVVSRESQQLQVSTAGQAQGSVEADKAAIQAAKVNLGYTKITSPINGVVGLRQVDPGNIVHASDATGLLVITQMQPIAVIFTLPEDQLPEVLTRVRSGKQMVAEAYDRTGTVHLATGYLLTADNQIDPTTGTDKLKAVFNNQDGALFPNQFVNIRLVLKDQVNATVIPAAAVQTGIQGDFVYVVKPGNPPGAPATAAEPSPATAAGNGKPRSNRAPYYAQAQQVEVGITQGTQTIINSGVNPGDQIVVDGQEKLKNGNKVIPHAVQHPAAIANGVATGTGNGNVGTGAGAAPTTVQQPASDLGNPNGPGQRGLNDKVQSKGSRP